MNHSHRYHEAALSSRASGRLRFAVGRRCVGGTTRVGVEIPGPGRQRACTYISIYLHEGWVVSRIGN